MDNLLTQAVALLQDDWVIYALPLFFTSLSIECGSSHTENRSHCMSGKTFSHPWA